MMAPVFKILSLALFLPLGSAKIRTRRPNRTGDNDAPSVTNSPDDNDSFATSRNIVTRTTARTSRTSSRTSCPTDQAVMLFGGQRYCCPGSFSGLGVNAACGVGCSGGSPDVTATALPTDRTCASTIMITEDDYSSKVAAATSRTGGTTTTSPGAAAMVTSGPLMGALAIAGGVILAV